LEDNVRIQLEITERKLRQLSQLAEELLVMKIKWVSRKGWQPKDWKDLGKDVIVALITKTIMERTKEEE
jgi:hypothetical protein